VGIVPVYEGVEAKGANVNVGTLVVNVTTAAEVVVVVVIAALAVDALFTAYK
jgi:hypothetical protein